MKLSALVRACLLALGLTLVSANAARADLAPLPDPDCDSAAVGTPCHTSRGLCQQVTDFRGRTRTQCVEDGHQCDRLSLGALCNPEPVSHCRQFTGDHGETWRACQDDAVEAMRTAPAMTETRTAHAATREQPAAESSGCAIGPTGRAPSAFFVTLLVVLGWRARRRR